MRLKWVCAGSCNATCRLYDLVGQNQGGGTCVYGWFFNGLLGIAQETLAHLAGIERSHVGKVERGEHMPTLSAVLKLAVALGLSGADLVAAAQDLLPEGHPAYRPARRASSSVP